MTAARDLVFPRAVQDPRDMFDRVDELERIKTIVRSRSRHTVVILGGRLTGKTSLLNVVDAGLGRRGSPTVVRLSPPGSRQEFMAEIAHAIGDHLGAVDAATERRSVGATLSSGTGGEAPSISVDRRATSDQALPTVARFVSLVQAQTGAHPRARFLLCIDEFDGVLEGCTEADARQILDLVLFLTEHTRLPIRFLFTMSGVPERVRTSYTSPFLNQATIVELRPWQAPRAAEFVGWLLAGRCTLSDAAQAALFRATGGHPYFVKAVLVALLAGRSAGVDAAGVRSAGVRSAEVRSAEVEAAEVEAAEVEAAVTAAAASREVAVALGNIVQVALPTRATAVLDRLAASPNGLTARELQEVAGDDAVLERLLDFGLLDAADGRHTLRLGLWSAWRGRRVPDVVPPRRSRIAPAVRRLVGNRYVRVVSWLVLGLLLCALTAGALVFLPDSAFAAGGCGGRAAGVTARISYPSYVSIGDEEELQVTVVNDGAAGQPATGAVVVSFPPAGPTAAAGSGVAVSSGNTVDLGGLGPGQQRTQSISFTYDQPDRWLPDTGSRVLLQLLISADGVPCSGTTRAMAVAPVPHLRALRNAAFGLMGLVVIPLLIEWYVRWAERRQERPRQESHERPHPPAGDHGPAPAGR